MKMLGFILQSINSEIALFTCENDTVSGVIHLPKSGDVTVILDGGYVMGKFSDSILAINAISRLTAKIIDGETEHGNYHQYKREIMGCTFSLIH